MSINATRTKSEAVLPESTASSAAAKEANTANQEGIKLPIASISDVLTLELIEKHLDTLSPDQLSQLYASHLPESTSPTKHDILDVVRSGFFQQSSNKLSELLREGSGAGYLLAQSLKYDYQGEGIESFLNGVRELGKKEGKEKEEHPSVDSNKEDEMNP